MNLLIKKSLLWLLLVCLPVLSLSAQEADSEELEVHFGIHGGIGIESADSAQTSFSNPSWQTEGVPMVNVMAGMDLEFRFNEIFSIFSGMEIALQRAGYNLSQDNYPYESQELAAYRFSGTAVRFPLKIRVGSPLFFGMGLFVSLFPSAPEWKDNYPTVGSSGTVDEKHFHSTVTGFLAEVGVRVLRNRLSIGLTYYHGFTPWIHTPYEEIQVRTFASFVGWMF